MSVFTKFLTGALLGLSRGLSFQPAGHQLSQFSRDTKDTPSDQKSEINFPNVRFCIQEKCFSFIKNIYDSWHLGFSWQKLSKHLLSNHCIQVTVLYNL